MNIELFKTTLAERLEKEGREKAAQDLRDSTINECIKRGEDIVCQQVELGGNIYEHLYLYRLKLIIHYLKLVKPIYVEYHF